MQTANPYIEELQKLKRLDEKTPEIISRIIMLEAKSREYTTGIIESTSDKLVIISQKVDDAHNDKSESLSKQYKRMCELYYEVNALLLLVRSYKKELRDEIATKRGVTK